MSNNQQSSEKIKMLKHDAIIIVKISTGFLQKLQAVLNYFIEKTTPEDIKRFNEEVSQIKGTFNFSEPWMQHMYIIGLLIREIEREGIEQGFSYEMDIEAIEKLSEELNKGTDLLPDQSPKQPE
jgi:hypothetical protein